MTKKHKPRAPRVKKTTKGRQTVVELDPDEEVDAWVEPAADGEPGSQPLFKPKWEKFAQLVAAGMQHAEAHGNAGFKADTANAARLAQKIPVKTRIDWLKHQGAQLAMSGVRDAVDASGINVQWIMERAATMVERCMQAVPMTVGGVPTGEFKFDSAGVTSGLRIIGEILGAKDALAGKERQDEQGYVAKSLEDPQVVADILNVRAARKLMLAGGKDVEAREKKPA